MSLSRTALIALSNNRSLRQFAENAPLGRRISGRFVAGTSTLQAIDAALALHSADVSATLDSLGESVSTAEGALAAAGAYTEMLDALSARGLEPNVSVKLSQMGMTFDPALTEQILTEMVRHAARVDGFVRIDMEDSSFTAATLAMTERLHAQFPGGRVGTVVQAYLYRSAADVERLLQQGIRIRLCKGAYREGADVAFPRKADVDENYFKLATQLLQSSQYHGLATHDETLIERIASYAQHQGIPPKSFEFQMLYGVRRDLQSTMVQRGFNVRVYVPFGNEWYPYFMRRLAERPANVLFLARSLLHA